uniref:Uncharacterized protein n=1 Tax=Euplotes crassus TaxID=5936 RepID=A0A7S3KHG5_EUPCR|mmetsp:Transcript_24370/g.24274  ORF Transcript_24370/g.24274 Transcript_24370/m.24274 type:complete len:125 (+) Transcript_24370:52-426(+)
MPSKKIFTRRKQSQIDVNGPNLHNIEVLQTLRVPKHALEYDLGNGDCEEGSERLNDNFSKYSVGVTENYGYFSYRKDYSNIENPSSRSKSRIPRYYRTKRTIEIQLLLKDLDCMEEREQWSFEN